MSFAFVFAGSFDDDGADTALLWEHGCRGVEERDGGLVAYFDARCELPLEGRWEEVETIDYLARYYAGLEPVAIGDLVVAPTHAPVTLRAGQKALWLDPGMAFGTGHHETTRLALAALEGLDLGGRRVLDVGAGSGILAIAADLLGAAESRGVDIDPETLPVARDNARLNRSRATFALGGLADAGTPAEVLVANLYAELHERLAADYAAALRPGGVLLVTGILAEREARVRRALEPAFALAPTRVDGEWILLVGERRS